jgi:ABC-2 type transport system permease protein
VSETVRALLAPIGNDGLLAVIWCRVMAVAGYVWAKRLYNRDPSR